MTKERVIWEGKPKYKPRWAFLEIFGGGAEVGPYTAVLPLILILIFIGIIKTYQNRNYVVTSLFIILTLIIMIGPEFHKNKRRKRTRYLVTNKRLTIYDFWYGKEIKNEIHLDDILKFALENYDDDCGIIHIYPKEKKFYTRNFWSGSERPLITFEDVENASKVFNVLNWNLEQYRERKKRRIET